MLNRIRETRKNESGFTLIELLIVIVILGVLAGIVVFAVGAFNNDGKAAACKSDVKNVEIAQEAFYAKGDPHVYAGSVGALVTANYLKEAPATSEGISTDTTGAVAHTCAVA
ncbi:MAG: type pilus assembly protein PilA [Pseudonocardiales bacterium]|nr:type pilus assembly protein PilA [Pseudonocardiales bacterium]